MDQDSWQLPLIACGLIVVAAACHLRGVALGATVQNAIVGGKLLLIGITILWASCLPNRTLGKAEALVGRAAAWMPDSLGDWSVFIGSMSWIALSYTGFNAAIYVAGESQHGARTVPRAMLLGTVLVTLIYWLLNICYVFAPPPEKIVGQPDVATIACAHIGGPVLSNLVRVSIVLAMTSSVFAMLLAGPRVYQQMALDGVMPNFLKGRRGAPIAATLVQAGISILVLFWADLLTLMKYLGLTLSACGALAVLSLWWVRRTLPTAQPLRWWENSALLIYLGITIGIVGISYTEHNTEFWAMLITFGLGIVVYLIWKAWKTNRHGK